MTGLVVGALLAAAVGMGERPRASVPGESATDAPQRSAADPGWLRRLRVPLCGLAFVAGWAFVGSTVGIVAGLVAAALSWRVLSGTEGPGARRRREQLEADLPLGVRLLAACLAAGSSVAPALRTVAEALPGPFAEEMLVLRHRLELGVDPALVWRDLGRHPQLGPLGRALGRAHQSGASVASSIAALADDLHGRNRAAVEERARSIDVKAAAPLGVCLLPAFMVLGVVPMVVGIVRTMHLFQ